MEGREVYRGDHKSLITNIKPGMNPYGVIKNILLFHNVTYRPETTPIIAARKRLLECGGCDDNGWVYYKNKFPRGGDLKEQDIARIASQFPKGIEFLALPGAYSIKDAPEDNGSGPLLFYDRNGYSLFIRIGKSQPSAQ